MSGFVATIAVLGIAVMITVIGLLHGKTMYRMGRRHGWTRRELDMPMWSEDENV